MSSLTETSVFTSTVNQVEDQELIDAILMNGAPQALTNRTRFLYDMLMNSGMKQACAVATTGVIALSGLQTIDGISVLAGDSVLVRFQTNAYENGIYIAAAGAWSRRFDCDATSKLNMATVGVFNGTANGKTIWTQITPLPVVGTTSIVFVQIYPHPFSTIASKPTTIAGYGISDMYLYSPPGAVTAFAGSAAPLGWFECDGSLKLKASYPALYAALSNGTIYGQDSTQFNVPDLRGEFIRGLDTGKHVDPDYASRTVGSAQADNLKSHTHTTPSANTGLMEAGNDYWGSLTTAGVTGATGITETRPRNIAMMYIIKY